MLRDYAGVAKDKELVKLLEKGEQLVLSGVVDKYNNVNKKQQRIIVVTDGAIYNFAGKSFINIFKGRLRRRISYKVVYGVTVSRHGAEFVIHIPKEHDYRLSSAKLKLEFVEAICQGYCKYHKSEMPCFYKDDIALTIYTTTCDDKKRGTNRMPREKPILLNPENIKSTEESKGSSKLVFSHKGSSSAEIQLEEFKLIKTLGRGAFGKVMLCEKEDSKELFAVKSLRKENLISTSSVDKVMTERRILETVAHPFIISLIYAFQTKEKIFFIMRFVRGGELYYHLKKKKVFPESLARFYTAQMVLAIAYLHEHGFVYRDIKPENILLGEDGYLLVADFGLAKPLHRAERTYTQVGTPEYMAPEIVKNEGHNHSVDWWSIGVLIFEMTHGKSPFYHSNEKRVYENICSSKVYFTQPNLSPECKDLVERLLEKQPSARLGSGGLAEVKAHKWFEGLDWEALEAKKLKPEFVPEIGTDEDLVNFDEHVTKEEPLNSVVDKPDLILLKKHEKQFVGMSFAPGHI